MPERTCGGRRNRDPTAAGGNEGRSGDEVWRLTDAAQLAEAAAAPLRRIPVRYGGGGLAGKSFACPFPTGSWKSRCLRGDGFCRTEPDHHRRRDGKAAAKDGRNGLGGPWDRGGNQRGLPARFRAERAAERGPGALAESTAGSGLTWTAGPEREDASGEPKTGEGEPEEGEPELRVTVRTPEQAAACRGERNPPGMVSGGFPEGTEKGMGIRTAGGGLAAPAGDLRRKHPAGTV